MPVNINANTESPTEGARRAVVDSIATSWPNAGLVGKEVAEVMAGNAASLPHFRDDEVRWVTIAPSAAALQREIELLRAWIIPSYAQCLRSLNCWA